MLTTVDVVVWGGSDSTGVGGGAVGRLERGATVVVGDVDVVVVVVVEVVVVVAGTTLR
jgi:hypothetical protein